MSAVTTVNPLDAASAYFADGTTGPALVIGSLVIKSPLFAILPGLANLYQAAPFALVFVLAFLQPQWTYTGYDASAHVAEETVMARLNSAWGVFLSVAVSAVVGYIVLMALTFAIPDIAATVSRCIPGTVHCLCQPFGFLRQHHRGHCLRRHVAVRPLLDHQHEPHVVRLRP